MIKYYLTDSSLKQRIVALNKLNALLNAQLEEERSRNFWQRPKFAETCNDERMRLERLVKKFEHEVAELRIRYKLMILKDVHYNRQVKMMSHTENQNPYMKLYNDLFDECFIPGRDINLMHNDSQSSSSKCGVEFNMKRRLSESVAVDAERPPTIDR